MAVCLQKSGRGYNSAGVDVVVRGFWCCFGLGLRSRIAFLNEVMGELATALRANHRFTPAYTPRANGTVEAVCKQVLRATKAAFADFGLNRMSGRKFVPSFSQCSTKLPRHAMRVSLQ
jgi:hypothetical protein